MLTGIIIIAVGLLIAVYPPLLSLGVAALLIGVGIVFVVQTRHARSLSRIHRHPIIQFILRY